MKTHNLTDLLNITESGLTVEVQIDKTPVRVGDIIVYQSKSYKVNAIIIDTETKIASVRAKRTD